MFGLALRVMNQLMLHHCFQAARQRQLLYLMFKQLSLDNYFVGSPSLLPYLTEAK
jgi:hypothetical protein